MKSVYLSYLLCINKFGRPPSDEVSVSELPPMYQQVWSATFWQSQCIWVTSYVSASLVCHLLTKSVYLSYLLCINKFGQPPSDEVSVSELPSMYQQVWSATFWRSQCIWVTFYVSTSLVCHLLTKSVYLSYLLCINKFGRPPSDEVNVSELPSMYQQVWSATFWRSQCIWVTFYVSTSLVCHLLTKSMYLSYLLCINKFGQPPSDKVSVSELPSMCQQVWSATFWRSHCIWVTFYVSTSLVCHLLPVAQSIETSTTKTVFLWYGFQRDVICLWNLESR